jgi:hypothetical protein
MYTQPSVPTGSRRRLPAIQRVQRDLRGRPSALLIRRLLRYLRLRLLRHTQFLRSLRPTLQRPSCRPRIAPLLRAPAHNAASIRVQAPIGVPAFGRPIDPARLVAFAFNGIWFLVLCMCCVWHHQYRPQKHCRGHPSHSCHSVSSPNPKRQTSSRVHE